VVAPAPKPESPRFQEHSKITVIPKEEEVVQAIYPGEIIPGEIGEVLLHLTAIGVPTGGLIIARLRRRRNRLSGRKSWSISEPDLEGMGLTGLPFGMIGITDVTITGDLRS